MFSLTPSHIIEYLYCPRFTWFEYVLRIPQHEEKQYKVMQGRQMHDLKLARNKDYLRRRVGATDKRLDVYLTNGLLRGRIDEVLWLADGTAAPLDYKFAKWENRLYDTLRLQLYCYAWLIQENFGIQVTRGYLVYIRSAHHLEEVAVTPADIDLVKNAAYAIRDLVAANRYPAGTKTRKRCDHCTYRNICTK